MFTEMQFKGLYTGRLSIVEYPEIIGFQVFGVVFLKFKQEMFVEHRVRLLSLLQNAKKEGKPFSLVLVFPDGVDFSGVDMNAFREIYNLMISFSSQLSMVCGLSSLQKLKTYGKTQTIDMFSNISDALINTNKKYLMSFEEKMTRNILVLDSDSQQREIMIDSLLMDRFSAIGVGKLEEGLEYILKFGKLIDGAIIEFKYPEFKEVELVKQFREINPEAKILMFTDMLDPMILKICQDYKIKSVVKSPFKPSNLLRKYKGEFPERETNFLGFKD